jgi:hypothetical protein
MMIAGKPAPGAPLATRDALRPSGRRRGCIAATGADSPNTANRFCFNDLA